MELKSPRNFAVAAHIVGWVIFFAVPLLISPGPGLTQYIDNPKSLYGFLLKSSIWVAVFYLNLIYVTPAFLRKKTRPVLVILLFVVVAVISTCVGWIDLEFNGRLHGVLPPLRSLPGGATDREPGPGFAGPLFSNLLITLIVFAVSSLIVLWNDWRTVKEVEQERLLQKVAVELAMLKLQISPHFLFNTLNNIRWLVRSRSEMAEPAIVKLSQLLRYILYQTNAEYVPLEKEIEHLRDYITLQQMRLTNTRAFTFRIHGEFSDKLIVPLLFLPIAENLFKYGDFESDAKNHVIVKVQDSQLNLSAVNRKLKPSMDSKEAATSGIGMENLKRRLELHYPKHHSISINETDEMYTLELKIDLD